MLQNLRKYWLNNMLPVNGLYASKIEGGVGALREFDDTNLLKPNGQSRSLNVYGFTRLVKMLLEQNAARRCTIWDTKSYNLTPLQHCLVGYSKSSSSKSIVAWRVVMYSGSSHYRDKTCLIMATQHKTAYWI